ncbi:hypothetical protein MKW94_016624 [Papaver nudicaule]|uniref:Uncharacterized protein n=1 Tax=Papaver nudicaule TaxID=74823 RepID=A0AA41RNV1_PAPNU|nr:hypothetical protein [Papaver nudicaule]
MEDHYLLQPFITTTTTNEEDSGSSSGPSDDDSLSLKSFIIRFLSIFFVAVISLWANHEASKTFEINIIGGNHDTAASRRFNLLYVSNDKISRIVLSTSEFAENILYPPPNESHVKKEIITRVTVKLGDQNSTNPVIVDHGNRGEFVLLISPSLLLEEKGNVDKGVVMAVQRGMARVWIYGDYGGRGVPDSLVQGMEEYVVGNAVGFEYTAASLSVSNSGKKKKLPDCWRDKNPTNVAHFLRYCEGVENGFIRRLNQGIRDRWDEKRTVDDALLGMSSVKLCAEYWGHMESIVYDA